MPLAPAGRRTDDRQSRAGITDLPRAEPGAGAGRGRRGSDRRADDADRDGAQHRRRSAALRDQQPAELQPLRDRELPDGRADLHADGLGVPDRGLHPHHLPAARATAKGR